MFWEHTAAWPYHSQTEYSEWIQQQQDDDVLSSGMHHHQQQQGVIIRISASRLECIGAGIQYYGRRGDTSYTSSRHKTVQRTTTSVLDLTHIQTAAVYSSECCCCCMTDRSSATSVGWLNTPGTRMPRRKQQQTTKTYRLYSNRPYRLQFLLNLNTPPTNALMLNAQQEFDEIVVDTKYSIPSD